MDTFHVFVELFTGICASQKVLSRDSINSEMVYAYPCLYICGIYISVWESISLVKLNRPTTHNVQVQRYMDAITF